MVVAAADTDSAVRLRAFAFLAEQMRLHGDGLPWSVLSRGFDYEGRRVPLVGPQGIFTPAVLRLPLTITTAPVVVGKERPHTTIISARTASSSTAIEGQTRATGTTSGSAR